MLTAGDVHVGIHHQSHDETVQLWHGECQIEQLAENQMMEEQTATHVHVMRWVEVVHEQSAPDGVCAVCSRQVARSLTSTAKLYATGEPTQTRHQFGFGRSAIAPTTKVVLASIVVILAPATNAVQVATTSVVWLGCWSIEATPAPALAIEAASALAPTIRVKPATTPAAKTIPDSSCLA